MTPLRILVVDDEPLALRRLRLLLNSISHAEQVGEASSCRDAVMKVASLAPDVLLLDIKMRDGTGFDVVEELAQRPNPPAVIFVTAFDHFALRAFESSVADYLLKPVERDRLSRALLKARRQLNAHQAEQRLSELQEVVRNLRSAVRGEKDSEFETEFWLRSANGLVRVPLDAVDCVSGEDEYVALHTADGSHLMRTSIRQLEARIDPAEFVRVHRRWLVRRTAIAELRTTRIGRSEILLRDGRTVPAGRVYLRQLRQALRTNNLDRRAMIA